MRVETPTTTQAGARGASLRPLLEALADEAPIGVALFDAALRYTALNATAAAASGLSVAEHIGKRPSEVDPVLGAALEPLLERVLSTGRSVFEPLLTVAPDDRTRLPGARIAGMMSCYALPDDRSPTTGSGVRRVAAVWTEAIAQPPSEVVLHDASEVQFRSMANTAPALIWSSGPDGGCDWFNDVWLDWTGSDLASELGDGWARGVHPDDLERCLGTYRGAVDRRQPFEMQYRLRRGDGSYGWLLDRGAPRLDANGGFTGFLGSCTDISGLKRLQDASSESLRRMQALQSVTAALSDVSSRDAALAIVLHHAVPVLDADGGVVAVVSDDGAEVEVMVADGYRSATVRRLSRFPVDAPLPLAKAIRTRTACRYGDNAEMLADNPGMADLVLPEVNRASLTVPMVVGDRACGALGLTWVAPHTLGAEETGFLAAIAGQLAQTLERIRLFDAEAAARREAERVAKRLAFLANASRILGASLDLDLTLSRIASISVPYLADWCLVHLANEAGPRLVTVVHDDPLGEEALRRLASAGSQPTAVATAVAAVLRSGRPRLLERVELPDLDEVSLAPRYRRALRAAGFREALIVPLQHGGETLGTLTLVNGGGRELDAGTRSLAEELAVRAGAAVANARAYRDRARIADELQASLLPALLPTIPGVELAARYAAGDEHMEVGGDFYDAFALEADRWLLVIGDVRGKGVEAAAVTGLARHTIRALALHHDRPAGILADLNRVLLREDASRDTEHRFGEPRFCTVCLLVVARDPATGATTATICAAGHPPPRLLHADGSVTEEGTASDLLGVLEEPTLTEHVIDLRAGDALVCVTDGITERRHGGMFFEDRLNAVLTAARDAGAEELAARLIMAASSHAPTAASDDMAVLTMRLRP